MCFSRSAVPRATHNRLGQARRRKGEVAATAADGAGLRRAEGKIPPEMRAGGVGDQDVRAAAEDRAPRY